MAFFRNVSDFENEKNSLVHIIHVNYAKSIFRPQRYFSTTFQVGILCEKYTNYVLDFGKDLSI